MFVTNQSAKFTPKCFVKKIKITLVINERSQRSVSPYMHARTFSWHIVLLMVFLALRSFIFITSHYCLLTWVISQGDVSKAVIVFRGSFHFVSASFVFQKCIKQKAVHPIFLLLNLSWFYLFSRGYLILSLTITSCSFPLTATCLLFSLRHVLCSQNDLLSPGLPPSPGNSYITKLKSYKSLHRLYLPSNHHCCRVVLYFGPRG